MVYLAKDSDFKNEYEEWIYIGSEKEVEIPEYIDGKLVTSTANMFNNLANATIVNKVVLKHNNVTDMNGMFMCYSSSQPLDLSTFDTTNVTNMSSMFNGYSSSQPLDLSTFDTTNVTNMNYMFSDVNNLKEVYTRTKEDAEKLRAAAKKCGISPKFYIVEKVDLDFKIALGNSDIESVYFKDKKGKLNELKIYKDKFIELQ